MCGIVGIAYLDAPAPHPTVFKEQLDQAATAIRHRGPDDHGTWVGRNVGFAHRRLSLLDLSARGHQPMQDAEGNILTFNGEIYNFGELRAHFPGQTFISHSDTEVVLKGLAREYRTWIKHLDGMFAFGFFSEAKAELLLAVDPAGKKPLYTYWDGRIFAFASEIKALRQIAGLDFSLSQENVKASLVYGYVPWPHTIYRFVRKLPAGHFQTVSLRAGPERPESYWDLPLGQTDFKIDGRHAQMRTRELLSDAVRKRLIADVPVGCFLSGGLDSSAVALEASRLLPKESLLTFAAGFSGDAHRSVYDETPFAQQVAGRIGSQHQVLQIDASAVDAGKIMRHFDEPFGDSSAIPTYLLCQQTARHVKAVLSGDGGDELFGGYLRFRAGMLSEKYQTLWQLALSPLSLFQGSPHSLLAKLNRFRSAVSFPLIKRLSVWNSFFTEEELSRYVGNGTESSLETFRLWDERTHGLPIGEKILYFNFKTYLFDDLLPKVDRMGMAHGLEVRSPFLDKRLIEFAFRLPTSLKFDPFRTKKILKDAYRPELGKDITDRAKHGFAFPLETFLASQSVDAISEPLRKIFPDAPLRLDIGDTRNRTSKQFMIFSLEQCLNLIDSYAH
jgi:asparagine synthase (glutamine-hydrolysing)